MTLDASIPTTTQDSVLDPITTTLGVLGLTELWTDTQVVTNPTLEPTSSPTIVSSGGSELGMNHFLSLDNLLSKIHSNSTNSWSGFFFSFYFLTALFSLLAIRHIPQLFVLQSNNSTQISHLKALSLYSLLITTSIALLANIMSDQTIDSQLLYVVFFLLTCIDAVIHAVLHHFLNHSHMPFEPHNMLEWGTACYFASAANPQLQTVIKELMIFQLLLIILLNTFGILNLLHRFRIVPTSIIGFAKIIHFVHLVVIRRQWYPMMFYLEMLAETLILIHIVLYTLIQLLGNWISGTTSTNSTMFFNINLSDDWNSVFKNWVERFALLANDTGFKNQLDPILFPIGLGLPPSLFIDLKTKVNPFHNNLMNQWKQKSDFINPKNQNLTRVLSLWNSMLSIPLIFIYKHLLKSINFILKLFVHRNVTPIHSESDDDSDYQPDEDQTDNEWTDEDDQEFIETTENNNSQITTNSRLDEDSDNLELYKELFELAKDNYNHSNQLRNENPMSMYHALFQNQDMKRQKRSRFTNNRSSTPSTPTISNPSYSSDVRSCVVCQTDQRCIVLRPCGCLSLCDDCRHAMATRHSHLCPCCRTTVIGYQKIYQP